MAGGIFRGKEQKYEGREVEACPGDDRPLNLASAKGSSEEEVAGKVEEVGLNQSQNGKGDFSLLALMPALCCAISPRLIRLLRGDRLTIFAQKKKQAK